MEITATAANHVSAPLIAERTRTASAGQFQKNQAAQQRNEAQAEQTRANRESAQERERAMQTRMITQAAAEVSLTGRIQFEYEQQQRVMKVQDSKGVLIYQVPPKGALHLVMQEEREADRLEASA